MFPFVISELNTGSKWIFIDSNGTSHLGIAADQISILIQKDISDGSNVQKWISTWTAWSDYDKNCPQYTDYGSQLPVRKRECQSTNTFNCIAATEEKSWIQRKGCPGRCGRLTDKHENCLYLWENEEHLKTKCVSSFTKPADGQHVCGSGGMKLPVPMTIAQARAWSEGYNRCDFEFHSYNAKMPVGLSKENSELISLHDGAKTQADLNVYSILGNVWKKGMTGCYDFRQPNTAGKNRNKCGQNGYCCSGSGQNNGEDRNNTDRACPSDAIEFIDGNNLQNRHHCLQQGYYHFNFRYLNS